MKRIMITIIAVMVVIGAIFIAITIAKDGTTEEPQTIVTEIADEEILDDCTDEYDELQRQRALEANSDEEKVSPNCSFTEKIYYRGCGHTTSNYLELPQDIVNLNREQVQDKYLDWQLEKFASNEIVLYQEKDGECGEHYVVRENGGNVVVYRILEDGTEELYEVTGISSEYLTDTDRVNMKNGIRVNGKQELNQLIEDFE